MAGQQLILVPTCSKTSLHTCTTASQRSRNNTVSEFIYMLNQRCHSPNKLDRLDGKCSKMSS